MTESEIFVVLLVAVFVVACAFGMTDCQDCTRLRANDIGCL